MSIFLTVESRVEGKMSGKLIWKVLEEIGLELLEMLFCH
jgi:hypothetical protein